MLDLLSSGLDLTPLSTPGVSVAEPSNAFDDGVSACQRRGEWLFSSLAHQRSRSNLHPGRGSGDQGIVQLALFQHKLTTQS